MRRILLALASARDTEKALFDAWAGLANALAMKPRDGETLLFYGREAIKFGRIRKGSEGVRAQRQLIQAAMKHGYES